MMKLQKLFLYGILILILAGCQRNTFEEEGKIENNRRCSPQSVRELELPAPFDRPRMEISGLAWYGDWLVFLPQYPGKYAENGSDGSIFYLERDEVIEYLAEEDSIPLIPKIITLDADDLSSKFVGYEGFEAFAFLGEKVFLTIESKQKTGMMGYIVTGEIKTDNDPVISLDLDYAVEIPPQANLSNMTDEALLIYEDLIYTFYEANGQSVNVSPVSHTFTLSLETFDAVDLINIPFRLTDVTHVDEDGKFWAMNYFYPGDRKLEGDFGNDPFSNLPTDEQVPDIVERIISLKFGSDGSIGAWIDEPICLELQEDGEARNWEGIVILDGFGFLMVTDQYPETIVGFVEYP
ncbi:MAG: hypothetical protein K8R40_12575 [Anaerolineaceae bacterium]|nr:hypothetical protein [Anaerolineaceae bacterium]